MSANQRGFTVVEVLVAVVVLSIGIVALVSSSAMVTRMIGRGNTSTIAAQVATRRLEQLRGIAASTTTRCTSANFVNGTATTTDGLTEQWVITTGKTTATRKVTVMVSYKVPGRGTRTDTTHTLIACI